MAEINYTGRIHTSIGTPMATTTLPLRCQPTTGLKFGGHGQSRA